MFKEINKKILKFQLVNHDKRLKTNKSQFKQNQSSQNQIIIKKAFRRFKSNFNEDNDSINNKKIPLTTRFSEQQNPRSKFLIKRKANRQMTQPQHKEIHPLKQYLNELNNQRKFKSMKRLSNLNEDHQIQSNQQNQWAKISQQKQLNALNLKKQINTNHQIIDQIWKKIARFKDSGYTQKKINQWVSRYCLYKRKYMLKVFMKPVIKNKFSNQVDYIYQRDINVVKQKILKVRKRVNGKDLFIDHYDLHQYSQYLENILIKKNNVKVFELKESIMEKIDQCFIYNRQKNQQQFRKRLQQGEKYNFVSDLNQIQQKTGRFQKITYFNRQYYLELGKTQKQIRKKIYDLINVTEKAKKKAGKKQLDKSDDWINQ